MTPSNPSKVVYVTQGNELPPSQFAAVFGTSNPTFAGFRLVACAERTDGYVDWPTPFPSLPVELTLEP